ncbi:MAG: MBL fold metallo-hydrolase [Acidimicrobiales bacterium]|jgi:glyoxylase-like metal-dependent hydrolase (beta-lactamase superfamily II)/rhodanese-related sulfurtransferase
MGKVEDRTGEAGDTWTAALMTTVALEAPGLGDRSYLISDGEVGVVVDPQRDPSQYLHEADQLGVDITFVLETHIHNDYVSGGLALARATGATYAIPAGEPVSFPDEFRALGDGDLVTTGQLEITAMATTGHTAHHLAYLIRVANDGDDDGGGLVVCTGGSLLVNSTGRTDLLGTALAEGLARAQWHSVRRLLTSLPKRARILPTHGFGSFCSATPTHGALNGVQTIAQELEQNPAALLDEDDFVARLHDDPLPIPSYYRYMAPLNRKGPAAPCFEPVADLDPDALGDAIRGAEWVVDLRQRREYADGHLPGTLNLELGANLTTYLGWIVPWQSALVLVANEPAEIDEARRMIARIGRDDLSATALWERTVSDLDDGRLAGGSGLNSYPVASFSDLAQRWSDREASGLHVLDVRHLHEWQAGHLSGARHVALPELIERRSEVPTTGQVWVHCGGGFRAAVAASLLSGWGASPVLIDDAWEKAKLADLPVVSQDD